MTYANILVSRDGPYVTVTMNRPERRNALSMEHMVELTDAFKAAGESDALGVIVAGNGPVFSAGHDFADMAGHNLPEVRKLFIQCTEMMDTMQSIPQVVIARVHGLATAAGCQLVATADLAVAADTAMFATPGGKGGLFCHTPQVALSRNVGRKRALEMALTGDAIDAATAAEWGLVNRVVALDDLERETLALLKRATRGSPLSKAMGKASFYAQVDMDQPKAYAYAIEVMSGASQIHDGQEGMASFLEKRPPIWKGR